jgi:hypothetical protein
MPQALGIGAVVAGLAGTAVNAAGAVSQGDYQAQVAQNNAAIARQGAANALQAGAQAQQQSLLQTAGLVSAARAAGGSSGLDVNSGSQVNVRASDEALGNLSALNIRSNTARNVYGLETQASDFSASAANDQQAGINSAIGAGLSGLGSLGGTAAQLLASGAPAGAGAPQIAGGGQGQIIYNSPIGPPNPNAGGY